MCEEICDKFLSEMNIMEYTIDNDIVYNSINHVIKIRLNFYQLWAMFNQIPIVYESIDVDGELIKHYEYRIKTDDNSKIYIIYANAKGEGGFLKTREWSIGSTTKQKSDIDNFLRHLDKALKMYKEYYKGIERHIFMSDNKDINEHMQIIKEGLLKNRDILKRM
jgi:hypothetical protein